MNTAAFLDDIRSFRGFGRETEVRETRSASFSGEPVSVATFVNEFWTSRQRAAHSLHELSYRACFKPQLPRFFIERLTAPGDHVYDPFMGRGTTPLEAALLGRVPLGCDVNPLSEMLVRPRLHPPQMDEIEQRLAEIDLDAATAVRTDLKVFYHPETLREICALRDYLHAREQRGELDALHRWIRMVAVNRLTGHSPGFFSVYTLPPNQAVTVAQQRKINLRRNQKPPRRDVREIILRKTRSLLRDCDDETRRVLANAGKDARFLTQPAGSVPGIPGDSVRLVVTSPPFLDIVNYAQDNWLRCWFCGIDAGSVGITMARKLEEWQAAMSEVFRELVRVLTPGGHVAFEVGEVRTGTVNLEEAVIPCGIAAELSPVCVLINDQHFTKTSNCWGVENRSKGTNTNRVVVFRKRQAASE